MGSTNENVLKHDIAISWTKGQKSDVRYGHEYGCRDKLDYANTNYSRRDRPACDSQWQLPLY